MDKLKLVAQTASEASTLGWGKRVMGFIACSVVAAVCLVLGVYMLCVPQFGLILFTVFYTFGNICAVYSTMFLMEPQKQQTMMFDETRVYRVTAMFTCFVLTLCAAFWWKSFELALFFCILQVLSFIWYCLSYIPKLREDIMKMEENYSKILSASTKFLMGLMKLLKWMYEKSPALAVIVGLVLTVDAAFLVLNFELGFLLFGILGGLLLGWCSRSSIPSKREDIMKMVEICSKFLSNCTNILMGLLKQLKSTCDESTALAIAVGLVLTVGAAFLWLNFGLGFLLFGILGGLLFYWCRPSFIPFVRIQQISNNNYLEQVTWMWDKAKELAIFICLLLSLLAACWGNQGDANFRWKKVGLAILFYILTLVLFIW